MTVNARKSRLAPGNRRFGSALALVTVLAAAIAWTGAARSFAQESPPRGGAERPLRLEDVHRGALLFKTSSPGVFLPAPSLSTDVLIRVTGVVARARVSQRFVNGTDACVEGIYVFPLPEGAAVDQLRMVIGDRVIEGTIQERQEAQKTYAQAKSEGRKAALLEQERPNIFTASIASIGAGEEIGVELEYQETLRYDQGSFSVRFPMVVGPRYIPGSPAAADTVLTSGAGAGGVSGRGPGSGWGVSTDSVPDADRITPAVLHPQNGLVNPVRLRVDLDPGFPLRRVASATHGVSTKQAGADRATVTLADERAFADRDFELAWEPDLGREPKAAVFTDRRSGETYALVMVVPPEPVVRQGARLPRETVFVIDTSGSMEGTSIDGARRALTMALGRLAPEDRFNVIEFNSVTRALYPDSRRALPDAVEEAKRWVAKLKARDGTEMLPALAAALKAPGEASGLVRQVLFMTDGAVGNEEELFRFIQDHLGSSRLFTVGLGSAPNSHFMTKAAEFGRGTFTYVANASEVDAKMSALFRKLEAPVLTNLEMVWDDASAEVWPSPVPDLYAGEPLVAVARLSSSSPAGGVTIRGDRLGEPWSRRLSLSESSRDSGLDRLWARRKIASLMDTMTGAAERDALRKQVVDLALSHHLVSSFTSLVAVDVSPTVARGVVCEARPLPVNLPEGWSYEHVFGGMPATATPARLFLLIGLAFALAAAGAAIPLHRRSAS
jgi:Ca-activated chloride channel family protein